MSCLEEPVAQEQYLKVLVQEHKVVTHKELFKRLRKWSEFMDFGQLPIEWDSRVVPAVSQVVLFTMFKYSSVDTAGVDKSFQMNPDSRIHTWAVIILNSQSEWAAFKSHSVSDLFNSHKSELCC